ncbi:hypothetical protein BOTBODRAFT_175549 [Botryobasidium botryosum FD-172 SS1]|uniref:Uncharacterized protein n=1 Tax=Botryobasidium botryosum (strain FD-172 SS1) TaxID=930990 RepID=A0A067MFR5_BOTB1|nr:hypothetical protein BOTBODRAFT_175549 [Botryobasidium botryosum FD-172 SS1]
MSVSSSQPRTSTPDLQTQLTQLFAHHPDARTNAAGQPVVPARALIAILSAFATQNGSVPLLGADEALELRAITEGNPDVEITPDLLVEFVVHKTEGRVKVGVKETELPLSPPQSSSSSVESTPPLADSKRAVGVDVRSESWHGSGSGSRSMSRSTSGSGNEGLHSRSMSTDSTGTSVYLPRRVADVSNPATPTTQTTAGKRRAVFEARQRSTPLEVAPPSSWSRRPKPTFRRRLSGASSHGASDSDASPSVPLSRKNSRNRTSNPTSPTSPSLPLSPPHSASSRPTSPSSNIYTHSLMGALASLPGSSRSRHRMSTSSNSSIDHSLDMDFRYPSHNDLVKMSKSPDPDDIDFSDRFSEHPRSASRTGSGLGISGARSPFHPTFESDSDSDSIAQSRSGDPTLVHSTSSPFSVLTPIASAQVTAEQLRWLSLRDEMEELRKANRELGKKLAERERLMQAGLEAREEELQELQQRIEELENESSSAKREEKDLRIKERSNSAQLLNMESEVLKAQKALDASRAAYQMLQKQYQEQCSESEKLRNTLRRRDQEIKDLYNHATTLDLESRKWKHEYEAAEKTVAALREDLDSARQSARELDEYKQENLLLKETIDRLRFDLDELRASNAGHAAHTGVANSIHGSMTRSLANELKARLMDAEAEEDADSEGEYGEDTDGDEDYMETIITASRRRKVGSRANKRPVVHVEETFKSYADAYTQHDPSEVSSSATTQTDPPPVILFASSGAQSEAEVPIVPVVGEMSVQTDQVDEDLDLTPTLQSIEIQTDALPTPAPIPAPEPIRPQPSTPPRSIPLAPPLVPDDDGHSAGDSSFGSHTTSPQNLKSYTSPNPFTPTLPSDQPPAYGHLDEEEKLKIGRAVLEKWHPGMTTITGIAGGVSQEAVEEWNHIKRELGFECMAVERVLQASKVTGSRRERSGADTPREHQHQHRLGSEHGGGDAEGGTSGSGSSPKSWGLIALGVGVWTAVVLAVALPVLQANSVPSGGPYADRQMWNAYSSLRGGAFEGFAANGPAQNAGEAVWVVAERLLFGAANAVRRMPT